MIDRIRLSGTDLSVSRICLGTGSYGSSFAVENCPAQLDYYYSLGGNFIDTALIYTDWAPGERARAEKILGRWMKERNNRHDLIIHAKGCHQNYQNPTGDIRTSEPTEFRLHRKDIFEDVDRTLELLQTDYIDIFTLHQDDESVPVEEIIDALEDSRKSGKFRYYGCSNWNYERQKQAYEYARSRSLKGFAVDQLCWSVNAANMDTYKRLDNIYMTDDLYRFHEETGIPVMAYSAGGRGFLQKKADGVFIKDSEIEKYENHQNEKILKVVAEIAEKHDVAIHTAVIRFLLIERKFDVIPIFACKTDERVDIVMDALKFDFDEEDLARLSEVARFM